MTAIIIFSVILFACAAAVIHLARDARADMDSEADVFDRRAEALAMRTEAVRSAVRRIRGSAYRDMPTVPAISRR